MMQGDMLPRTCSIHRFLVTGSQWACLLAVLVCATAVVAAAPAAGPSDDKQPGKTLAYDPDPADVVTSADCPGLQSRVCGKACQLRLCKTLADIYRISNNLTDPWDNERGWELTSKIPCEKLVAGSPRQAVYCNWFGITCCTPAGLAGGRCSAVNGITALEIAINNINVSVANPLLLPSLKKLHGCGMRVLNMEANNVIGAFSDEWGELNKLRIFTFGNCWIAGTIPNGLRRLRYVTLINLSNNWINGTLPSWLSEFTDLRVLNLGSNSGGNEGSNLTGLLGTIPSQLGKLTQLRELNLEANSLTGTLPEDICTGDESTLLLLNLRGNQLNGSAHSVEHCGNLVQLDISQNRFSGALPVTPMWDELATYRAGSNQFTGSFPLKLASARILEHLDVSNNLLTGILPAQVTLLSSLKTLVASNNRLVGTINENVYYLPSLAKLDLSNNSFVGTITKAIGLAYGLQDMDISNNAGVTGQLPPQMGLLSRLRQVRTSNTNVSCAGITRPYIMTTNNSCTDPSRCKTPVMIGNEETQYHVCEKDKLLPCFLKFSDYMVPRDDDSNMRCKIILRRPVGEARAACSGEGNTTLGEQASALPDLAFDRLQQLWNVGPSYYQYQMCECLLGYKEEWRVNRTQLRCVLDPPQHQAPTAIIVGVVAGAAVAIIGLLAWWQYMTTRPRWLRERILQAKRSRGAPKATKAGEKVTVSIVVTDVQDFSDLTRQYPGLISKAMGIHNNILRKACHTHAGYIMDQEGDSWTVAFHDAEDAVAFSLQVQQALAHKVGWGKPKLVNRNVPDEMQDLTHMRDGVFSTRFSHTAQTSLTSAGARNSTDSYVLMGEDGYGTPLAAAGQGSFTGVLRPDSLHSRINTSFTSSGRVSNSDRSFTLQRNTAVSDDGSQAHSLPLPTVVSSAGGGHRGGLGGSNSSGKAAAAVAAAGEGSKHNGHAHSYQTHPRQVSFTDAQPSRDAHLHRQQQQQQQQQPLIQLVPTGHDEHGVVQPSGPSSGSWPEDHLGAHGASQLTGMSGRKSSFASTQPGSLSVTAPQLSISGAKARSSSSGSKLWNAGAAVMRRFSAFGRGGLNPMTSMHETANQPTLNLSVRIGIATGHLQFHDDLNSCPAQGRAKNLVSEVANGGQILLDENTFRAIKDSLSVLGTVNEAGYDDRQLQQLLHSQVVTRLQHHMSCGCCECASCRRGHRDMSFSSQMHGREPQDYDNDALVVHMGAFEAPTGSSSQRRPEQQAAAADSSPSTPSATGDDTEGANASGPEGEAAAVADGAEEVKQLKSKRKAKAAREHNRRLHLYAIAAPGMRMPPSSTQDLGKCMSWSLPVHLKRGWVQLQKGYFDAPGARQMDLTPSSAGGDHCQAVLPDVTIVFAQVAGAAGFTYKRNRHDAHAVNKAVTRCMLEMLDQMPDTDEGKDGYLCRCQEADLKYMVAFKAPYRAVQWCLMVQEALMYFNWPDQILTHPGFEEVLDPITGLPLFRGPRLRMGLAEGQPNSVLPDHAGRANYYGHSVNRAARFMDVAAHGGQIVTDLETARKLFREWRQHCFTAADGLEQIPSRAHSDADVPQAMSAASDSRHDAGQDNVLHMLVSRSQSETTGNCRPSASMHGRLQMSRLDLRRQHQQMWLQQLQQQRQAAAIATGNGTPLSSPLPELMLPTIAAAGEQLVGSAPSGANRLQQQQQQQKFPLPPPSGASFTRKQQQLHVATPEGSFSRQQLVTRSGNSFSRQHIAGSGSSFTRQQLMSSGGSFTHRQQQVAAASAAAGAGTSGLQLPASSGVSFTRLQHPTSMGQSFSSRRAIPGATDAAAAAGAGTEAGSGAQQHQQQFAVMQSAGSFVLQVPAGWQASVTEEVAEALTVNYVGTYSFKGSGVFEMVNILNTSLVGRQFPEEAPKGKGSRIMPAEGPVQNLDQVVLHIPPRLLAARQAFHEARNGCP